MSSTPGDTDPGEANPGETKRCPVVHRVLFLRPGSYYKTRSKTLICLRPERNTCSVMLMIRFIFLCQRVRSVQMQNVSRIYTCTYKYVYTSTYVYMTKHKPSKDPLHSVLCFACCFMFCFSLHEFASYLDRPSTAPSSSAKLWSQISFGLHSCTLPSRSY